MKKGFIMLFVAITMLLCLPLVANAEIVEQGSCGENVTYTLDDQGTLTISGTSVTKNYNNGYPQIDSPFYNNGNIKNVIIEDGVTNIGGCMFDKCYNMTSVEIPDSVTSIEYRAFRNCASLQEITIPNSVTRVGVELCLNCSGLKRVTIGENVTNIGLNAFEGCNELNTIIFNAINCSNPSSYSFKGIFYNFTSIKTVTIGEVVKTIPQNLFNGCSGITEVNIGRNIAEIIGFNGCDSIQTVNYSGDYFEWQNVEYKDKFDGATIVYKGMYQTENGYIGYKGNEITAYIGTDTSIEIPSEINGEKITSIGANAFENCSGLIGITIPDSVTNIGSGAFSHCSGLTNITIPENVTNIGNSAFADCNGMTSIIIPDSVTNIEPYAFKNCNGLQSITIGKNTAVKNGNEFDGCSSLTDIYYNGTLSELQEALYAYGKTRYTNLTVHCNDIITYSVGKLGDNITYVLDSNGIFTVSGTGDMGESNFYSHAPYYDRRLEIKGVIIGDGITNVGAHSFKDCSNLVSVELPDSVTEIEASAFSGCTSLASITIPDSITDIENSAFSDCTALISAIIPDSVTNIGSSAFSGCSGMTKLTLPNSITKINDYSFVNCSSLKDVTIPDSVTEIGNSVFSGCTALEHINIGNSVETIGMYTFSNSGLTEVTIPANVKVYCNHPFQNCENLTPLTLCGDPYYNDIRIGSRDAEKTPFTSCPALTEVVFSDEVENIRDYVLQSCATVKKVSIGKNVKSIGSCAFQGTSISEFTLPDELETIGNYVVRGCKDLQTVTVGKNVSATNTTAFVESSVEHIIIPKETENFSFRLFSGCSNLLDYDVDENNQNYCDIDGILFNKDKTKLISFPCSKVATYYTIPSNVTELSIYSFVNCNKLQNVTIPNGINRIPMYAFSDCGRMKSITIPLSVQNIANNALNNCFSLKDIYYAGNAEQWRAINIGSGNTSMGNAIIHYNSTDIPDIITPTPYTPLECNIDYEVADNNITFTVEVKDIARADELKSIQLYAAEFDENGRFIGLTTGKNSDVEDGKITITAAIPDTKDYRFFLWDGFLAPLMSVLDSNNLTK